MLETLRCMGLGRWDTGGGSRLVIDSSFASSDVLADFRDDTDIEAEERAETFWYVCSSGDSFSGSGGIFAVDFVLFVLVGRERMGWGCGYWNL